MKKSKERHDSLKRKNILYITHDYMAFTKDQIEQLSNHFKDVYVLVRYNKMTDFSGIIPLKLLTVRNKKEIIDTLACPKNVHVIPAPVFYIPSNSGYKKAGASHYQVVKKLLKRNRIKFDLIHSHFIWSAGYVGARLKQEYNVPFVITAHGYDVYNLPFRDDDWKERITSILNATDHIITISNLNIEYLSKLDITTPIDVISNGFDGKKFFPKDTMKSRKTLNLPRNRKIVMTIGNLLPIKGQKYLIEAINRIIKKRADIFCVIIGDGKLEKSLTNLISKFGLQEYVILVGKKPHNEIPAWINACDIFVIPSLKESGPVVLFEALACGKPVIGTEVGVIPEILEEHRLGSMIPPGNSKVLATNILKALKTDWSSEFIQDYVQKFTWKNISDEILNIYSNILK